MESIKIVFWGVCPLNVQLVTPQVVLTMDEDGKRVECVDLGDSPVLPQRVWKAFTKGGVERILALDEIPTDDSACIVDGYNWTIEITKGGVTKVYEADDASIDHYPLLRYLASWYRRRVEDMA